MRRPIPPSKRPPNPATTSDIEPPIHPSWCRGPADHIVDPGTTPIPPHRGAATAQRAMGRLGVVAVVTPVVYAVLDDRLAIGPELIGQHVALGDDLAIDSLDLLEVVIELESAFGIVVPEREIDRLRTVADLIHVVAKFVWERDHPEPFLQRVVAA